MKTIIHNISASDVQRLELGIPINIGGGHFIQSKDYVQKMIDDEIEFREFNETFNPYEDEEDIEQNISN